jgi:hypothetical protein
MSDLLAKVEAMRRAESDREAERVKIRQQRAAEHRAKMPTVAAWISKAREVFGHDCRVVFASENGITIGERSEPGVKVLSQRWVGPPLSQGRK